MTLSRTPPGTPEPGTPEPRNPDTVACGCLLCRFYLCRLHLSGEGERTASERARGQCVHVVAAGQGDETVERVVVAHHIVEFRTVGGDGVRVTEYDRNGYARMRARVARRQIRGSGAQGGHVEERAEGNPNELQ